MSVTTPNADVGGSQIRQFGWTDGRNVWINYQYAADNVADMRRLTRETVARSPTN